jgi:hypothetical protein
MAGSFFVILAMGPDFKQLALGITSAAVKT